LRQVEGNEDYYLRCAWRAARDARKRGAAAQEAHETLITAPLWRVEVH